MKIKSFHNFSMEDVIYEKKNPPAQNTPTQTDTDYRKNMNIPKQDTGDDSAGLYTIFLTQASTVLNSMSTNVALVNPNKGTTAANRITALVGNIKPTYESHKKLWNGIETISNELGGDSKKGKFSDLNALDPSGEVLSSFKQNLKDLESRLKTKNLSDTEYSAAYDKEASEIRVDANKQLDSARSSYYLKIGRALDYFMQAIKVYKQGALLCLQNMESESDENENTGKNYLSVITKSAINILGKK